VADAVARARAAGIRVLMVTGDHPATARAVAHAVGIAADRVCTGGELDAMNAEALRAATRETGVFARVTPAHKLRIVEALVADGEVVAMTGDGVNDAPALKRADVGVAMGRRGSDVTREVADLVLLDDDFATIVAAIEEGRSIDANVRKFIRFLFSTNLSELFVVTLGAVLAFACDLRSADGSLLLPLTAAQLLWINLATDGAPALALGLDRNPGVMRLPPRSRTAPLLDGRSLRFVVVSGTVQGLLALGLFALLPVAGESRDAARTAAFLFLCFGQLLFAYPARRTRVAPVRNTALHAAAAGTAALQAAALAVPSVRHAFHVELPSGPALLAVVAAVAVALAVGDGVARRTFARPPLRDEPLP
jgi:Ca2+-transporting ATPase